MIFIQKLLQNNNKKTNLRKSYIEQPIDIYIKNIGLSMTRGIPANAA